MRTKECDGCNDHEDCWLTDTKNCPCINCLVKAMCRTACEPFNEFEETHFTNQEVEYTREYKYETDS